MLLPLVAVPGGASSAGPVLAVLLGVNIGPNLTYTGSLATLLWRRVLRDSGTDAPLGEFTRLGVATVVPGLALAVLCLWLALKLLPALRAARPAGRRERRGSLPGGHGE